VSRLVMFACARFFSSRPSSAEEFQQVKPELNLPCWLWLEKSRVLALSSFRLA